MATPQRTPVPRMHADAHDPDPRGRAVPRAGAARHAARRIRDHCGQPNPSGRRRVAVRRLTREFDLPFRKGCPGRPRTRQIGRSDAEFLWKHCDSFALFYASPLCLNRDRLVTRRATQRPPRWGGTAKIRRHARRPERPDDRAPSGCFAPILSMPRATTIQCPPTCTPSISSPTSVVRLTLLYTGRSSRGWCRPP